MTLPVAVALDTVAALGVVAVAAAWLVARGVRFARRAKAGQACCAKASCGPGGPSMAELRAAAARGASRMNREGSPARSIR